MAEPINDDSNFDSLVDNLKKSAGSGGAADVVLELEKLRQEREDKRAERAEQIRREERAEAKQAEFNKLLLGLATSLLPSLLNKGTDPAIIALMSNKGGNLEEVKAIMDLQRSAAQQQAQMMQQSFLEILKTKEEFNQQMLAKAMENGGDSGEEVGGFAGTLREVRLALGALAPNGLGAPAATAPGLPAPTEAPTSGSAAPTPPPAPPARAAAPAATVLHQLKALQEGKMKAKPAIMRAALVTVTLQDEALVEALLSEDADRLLSYCAPFVQADAALMEWVQRDGVIPWLTDYIDRIMIPLVEAALDDGTEPDEEETDDSKPVGKEPETLIPQHVPQHVPQPRPQTAKSGAAASVANQPAPAGAKG